MGTDTSSLTIFDKQRSGFILKSVTWFNFIRAIFQLTIKINHLDQNFEKTFIITPIYFFT
jgi:hypothetical protein